MIIDNPNQVQIYESIMGCMEDEITTSLMLAHHYIKDNRLLPAGFDKSTAGEAIQVAGEAQADANFTGGRDQVRYRVIPLNMLGLIRSRFNYCTSQQDIAGCINSRGMIQLKLSHFFPFWRTRLLIPLSSLHQELLLQP
jgi:hypothetical protein